MKNPFIKESNSLAWITAGAAGIAAAGAGIWYYIKQRREGQLAAAYAHEHAGDYLEAKQPHKRKQRTDVHNLGDIVHHQQL
ncbi:MAG: hypothetical protein ABIN91_15410 [Mucilaginibacter sp.]|uniref:hypothetical protein n=1 Tax=Mucilaginibacter sp. TaxID=1882438 RepID=UPI0032644257